MDKIYSNEDKTNPNNTLREALLHYYNNYAIISSMYTSSEPFYLIFLTLLAIVIAVVVKMVRFLTSTAINDEVQGNALKDGIYFRNLVLHSGYNTRFTEIDEVIVSQYGIFCVEYKSHVGFIFGNATNSKWTQCRYDGKRQFYNPIHQNYKHIKALERTLGNNVKVPIHNIVVFTRAKKLKVDSGNVILGIDNLNNILRKHTAPIYSPEELGRICRTLAYAEHISKTRLPTHINELRQHLAKSGV